MSNPSKAAMEKARDLITQYIDTTGEIPSGPYTLSDTVAHALDEAERRGLERAACVADDYDGDGLNHGQDWQLGDANLTMADIARQIRALIEGGSDDRG